MVSEFKIERMRGDRLAGFSLIELLVVIAIIALLAAIIFPVFSTIEENSRQSNSMSNMHDISTKLAQYKLDTQQYPPVLFGYFKTGTSMSTVLGACQADNSCSTYLPGLYPEYVKSWTEFTDPNNNAKTTDFQAPASETHLCATGDAEPNCAGQPVGTLVLATTVQSFYAADSYDWSPQVTSSNSISKTVALTRYETSWTSIAADLDCSQTIAGATPPAQAANENLCFTPFNPAEPQNFTSYAPTNRENQYTDQLRWQNPPSSTYVTCTTWHVQQASIVLVLTEDGAVQKVDAGRFAAVDTKTVDSIDTNGVDSVDFWRISL